MRKLCAYFITLYQQNISPHKGFTCAHKGLHGGDSCSEYAKKKLLEKGTFNCLKAIKQRFQDCHSAAGTLQQRPRLSQRGDCDLGLSGCDMCVGGSEASSAAECVVGDCSSLSMRSIRRLLLLLLMTGLIIATCSYYFIGRQISSIDIRIKSGIEETTDKGTVSKIFHSQLPDYKVYFYLRNGMATTNTLKNTSAKNWINLKTNQFFYLSDITKIVIVNKGIIRNKELETITKPQKKGNEKIFEYSIHHRWALF